MKDFELLLSDVQQSYLVKPMPGKAVIEDQQAVVKLVRTERGEEDPKIFYMNWDYLRLTELL